MALPIRFVVSALICDGHGRIFVQRRAADRCLFPDCWDLVGGHVDPGETNLEALAREIREETGWRLARVGAELRPKPWTADRQDYLERQFIIGVDGDLDRPAIETTKVSEWLWITPDIVGLLKQNRPAGDTLIHDSVVEAFALLASPRGPWR